MMHKLSCNSFILRLSKVIFLGMLISIPISFQLILAKPQQTLALRAIESRFFQTSDQQKIIEAVVSTLQDMGYIIIRTDHTIGFVTATQFNDDITEITVTTQPEQNTMIVRASARINNLPLHDATFYQNFFNHLSQALFLNANAIY